MLKNSLLLCGIFWGCLCINIHCMEQTGSPSFSDELEGILNFEDGKSVKAQVIRNLMDGLEAEKFDLDNLKDLLKQNTPTELFSAVTKLYIIESKLDSLMNQPEIGDDFLGCARKLCAKIQNLMVRVNERAFEGFCF